MLAILKTEKLEVKTRAKRMSKSKASVSVV